MVFPEVLMLLCLAVICYQDLRYRAVYWICFPVLGVLLLLLKYKEVGITAAVIDSTFGILFFSLQLFLLWIWFSVKNKRIINLTRSHLGWGDVLFLAVVPFYLSPVNYIVFYMASLLLVLIYTAGAGLAIKAKNIEIPLAGLQACMLGILFTISIFLPSIKLYDDSWLYRFQY